MTMRKLFYPLIVLLGLPSPTPAYIDASPTLGRLLKDSTNIVVLRVEKVSKDKRAIIYTKVADLKGKYAADQFKHQLTDGWHPGESKLILDWAEPGRIAVCFLNGKSALTCIDSYWYGATARQAPWWVMTSGEARLAYAYVGRGEQLREHLKAMLDGQEVIITVVQFSADRQKVYKQRDIADFKNVFRGRDCPICRIKASLKMGDSPDGIVPVGLGVGGPEDIPALLKALEQKDGKVRADAAERLGQVSPPARAALPALLAATKDENGLVRVKAADSLSRIDPENKATVSVLIEALRDENGKVRRVAAETLGDIGPGATEAVAALITALKDADENVRWAAAGGLRDMGPVAKAAVQPLTEALQDPGVRTAAAEALGGIGQEAKAAVPALQKALRDKETSFRRGAAWALVRIGSQNEEAAEAAQVLVEGFNDHPYMALELLRRIRAPANVPALTKLLKDDNVYTRWMAARILGENGPAAKAAVPALIETLKDKERPPRIWAAIALGDIGPEAKAAVPALATTSKTDEFDQVRWHAAASQVWIASEKAVVPLLIEAVKGPRIDDYFHSRQRAIEALGQLGPAGRPAVPALVEALTDKYSGIRACAAAALGRIGPDAKDAIPALTAAMKEKDEGVRSAAAAAIKKIGQK
jgi:HEAT repeat protein